MTYIQRKENSQSFYWRIKEEKNFSQAFGLLFKIVLNNRLFILLLIIFIICHIYNQSLSSNYFFVVYILSTKTVQIWLNFSNLH